MQPTTPHDSNAVDAHDPKAVSGAGPGAGPNTDPTSRSTSGFIISAIFRGGIAVVIIAIAAGIVFVLVKTKEQPAMTDEELAPIRVRTISAQAMSVDRTWDGYGTSRSMNDADVVAEVGGRVVERPASIEPGKKVEVGTVLMRLDAGDYANALNAANQAASAIEAQLDGLNVEAERASAQITLANDEIDAAERDLDRTRQAIDAGAGNIGELDSKTASVRRIQREVESLKERVEMIPSRRAQLLAQLAGQRANAATAQENLDRSVIRSPIAGVIQSVSPRRGDWVSLGTPVARVVDLSRLEIPVRLPTSAISWIRLGDEVRLWEGEPTGDPDQTGIITRIAPEADAANRTVTVYVEVDQDPDSTSRLSPGRFVLGRVRSPDDQRRFVVPRRAVQGSRLMLATRQDDGTVRIEVRPVETGYSIDGRIESLDPIEDQWTVVRSGLHGGELVVVSLLDQIGQGMIVRLIGDNEASPESNTITKTDERDPAAAAGDQP